MFKSLITPWRLKWYPFAVLFGISLAVVIAIFSGTGPDILSGRLGGDFPAFYAAGRIVTTVGINRLYNLDHQVEWQKDLFPDRKGFLPFPYPPFVALAYAPLSLLPYRIAYTLNFLVNISAFLVTFVCLKKTIPKLAEIFFPVFALSLTFYPILKALLNGQNSAITLMLFSLIWRLTIESRKCLAGFFMGLLLYKPQFAIPLIGIFLLSGRLKIVFSSVVTGCIIIAVSLFYTGVQPYEQWYIFLKWFVPSDANVNGHNAISWIGFLDAVFGTENRMAFMLGYACCFATVFIISYVWTVGRTKSDFNAQMGLAAVSFVLIPPHIMYYDAGLIVLTYAVIMTKINRLKIELICFVWFAGMTQIVSDKIGFSPIFLLVCSTYFIALFTISAPAMRNKIIKPISENN